MRLLACSLSVLLSAAASAASIEGSWEGKLQTSGVSLRIVFNISSRSDGSLQATMDSPDQSAYGIPVDSVTLVGAELRCEIKRISGIFEGRVSETERSISGFWTQYDVPMTLDLVPKVQAVRQRPQEPVKPYPYSAEEIKFANASAGVTLAGTFTKPSKGSKFPAVILITGSGPQNRDSEIMGHKPFLVLADELTRRGIAVLRVDDRGVGGSTSTVSPATSEDFAADVLAGLAYLKTRRDVDKRHIGLIGHSEGGLIAPMAAAKSKDVAFIVLLAGPGVRGADLLAKQRDALLAARGVPESTRALANRLPQRLTDIAVQASDEAAALAAFDKFWADMIKSSLGAASESQSKILDAQAEAARTQLKQMTSPWMHFFLTYDPAPTLQSLKVPVLAINGTLDTQVVATQNLPAIEAALKAGGNRDYKIETLTGLNHLFQSAKTGAPSEYIEIEETINPGALEAVGNWVVGHSGIKSQKK
jgi:pimeloyl-ACP methyl ester carboxylesterase